MYIYRAFFVDIAQKLPVITDDQFVPDIHREILALHKWTNPALKAVTQFAWAITLRALSQYPSIQGNALINSF